MVDRASTFAHPALLETLRRDFVPVAIDQAYERRQKDRKGEFYRRIAGQGPRKDFRQTTQGFYVATAGGELLLFNNNRNPDKVARLVGEALERFSQRDGAAADPIDEGELDPRYSPTPPDGGFVARVHGRVLGGYPEPESEWDRLRQEATSRDNLWATKAETEALANGTLADSLLRRIARFHLVDGTRGEPPMWRADEVRALDVTLEGTQLSGRVRLATADGSRSYDASLLGFVEHDGARLTRFDVVALGSFVGDGRYTRGAPPGPFPLAIRISLADGTDIADAVPPQGAKGWLEGYLR